MVPSCPDPSFSCWHTVRLDSCWITSLVSGWRLGWVWLSLETERTHSVEGSVTVSSTQSFHLLVCWHCAPAGVISSQREIWNTLTGKSQSVPFRESLKSTISNLRAGLCHKRKTHWKWTVWDDVNRCVIWSVRRLVFSQEAPSLHCWTWQGSPETEVWWSFIDPCEPSQTLSHESLFISL